MNKSTSVFGAIAIVTLIPTVILWQQLREDRDARAPSQGTTQTPRFEEPIQELTEVRITAPAQIPTPVQAPAAVPVVDGTTATVSPASPPRPLPSVLRSAP